MNLNSLCSLLRCSRITLQKYNRDIRATARKKTSPVGCHQIKRCFCSSEKINLPPAADISADPADSQGADEFEYDATVPYRKIDFSQIAGHDPKKVKELELIQLEIDMMYQDGEKVPKTLTVEHWKQIARIVRQEDRIIFLRHLWLKEVKTLTEKQKKLAKTQAFEERKRVEPEKFMKRIVDTSGPITYGLSANTLFHRVYDSRINKGDNYRLLRAMMFGPRILLDCSFEPYMSVRDMGLCAKQLLFAWSDNRDHRNPYHLIFCDVIPDGEIMRAMRARFPTLDEPDFPFFYTTKNYLDLYPKERLVYLSADSLVKLDRYHPEDVYIIGAMVDKNRNQKLTLAKAKKQGIRMAQFPLDKYLTWSIGKKTLTINQALAIMNDLKDTNNWNVALRHVPPRKIIRKIVDEDSMTTTKRNLVYDKLISDKYKSVDGNG